MVGSLVRVGEGAGADALADALAARDRRRCGPMAPAHGLYLAGSATPDVARCSEACLELTCRPTLHRLNRGRIRCSRYHR